MKHLVLGAAALLAFSGLAFAGGEACCQAKATASVKTPLIEKADGLLAKWKEAAAKPAAAPSETDMKAMAKAGEVLAANCPVCKRWPDTVGFFTKTIALSNGLERACEKNCSEAEMAKMPAEMKTMFAEHSAVLDRSQRLLGATFAMMGKGADAKDCCKDDGKAMASKEKKDEAACCKAGNCESNPACYAELEKKADALLAAWSGIPAEMGSLKADTRNELLNAMETMQKINPGMCATFREGILTTGDLVARAVAIETELMKGCADHKCDNETEEQKAICKSFHSRYTLLQKTSKLLTVVAKMTNPENKAFSAMVQ